MVASQSNVLLLCISVLSKIQPPQSSFPLLLLTDLSVGCSEIGRLCEFVSGSSSELNRCRRSECTLWSRSPSSPLTLTLSSSTAGAPIVERVCAAFKSTQQFQRIGTLSLLAVHVSSVSLNTWHGVVLGKGELWWGEGMKRNTQGINSVLHQTNLEFTMPTSAKLGYILRWLFPS